MIAIKGAIFIALVSILGWAGVNLAHAAFLAWPKWSLIEGGGAIGCAYALTDLLWRYREWIGLRGEYRPRRHAWSPWR